MKKHELTINFLKCFKPVPHSTVVTLLYFFLRQKNNKIFAEIFSLEEKVNKIYIQNLFFESSRRGKHKKIFKSSDPKKNFSS